MLVVTQAGINGLQPGESVTLNNAFSFTAGNDVPNGYNATFILNATATEGSWSRTLILTAYSPLVEIASVEVVDGNNGILEAGETALLSIGMRNAGGVSLTNAEANISSWDPYLNIITATGSIDTLNPAEVWPLVFAVSLSSEAPENYLIEINLAVSGDHQFDYLKTIPLFTGSLIENFESGDFAEFEWTTGGDNPWVPEAGFAHEGNWCARSGVVLDNQMSTLSITWNVAFADSVSFWFMVSSEPGYDYLHFNSNLGEMGKWAGTWNWTRAKFGVPAGEHNFVWKYLKDYSVSNGEDCARIDYIVLPVFAVPTNAGNKETNNSYLDVYPNPGQAGMNITYSLEKPSPVQIIICDMHGNIVFRYEETVILPEGNYQLRPELPSVSPGIYTVILRTNSGTQAMKIIRTSN